jgi:SulP family sulfate permease
MTALDATGLRALEDVADRTKASGRTAIFCGAREQPRALMKQSGFADHVGRDNVVPHVQAALERAKQVAGP